MLDCVVRVIKEISVRCRSVYEVIGSIVFDILIVVFHLETSSRSKDTESRIKGVAS